VELGLDDEGLVAQDELVPEFTVVVVVVLVVNISELIPGAMRNALWGLISHDAVIGLEGTDPIIIGAGYGKDLLPDFGCGPAAVFFRDLSALSTLETDLSYLFRSSSSSIEMLSTVVRFIC
jgi:hypothetical protein